MSKSQLPLKNVTGGATNDVLKKEALVKLLRWHFGHSDFRGTQFEAIHAVLSGRDCFCLMPTGGGKSICYQIPALAKRGIVLVVSPLIALMENQVMALKDKGIAAEYLSSTQTAKAKNKIYEDLETAKPSLRLLYVTPELIATSGFMTRLLKIYARGLLSLIAIDEAHCVSTWGHDFRPSYRKLSSLRNKVPGVPVLALTATAVPKVQKDVIDSLGLQNPLVLKSSFNRPNIYYEVRYKDLLDDPYYDVCSYLKSCGNICAIIYCLERTTCDDLAAHLSNNGISCAAYHAGLNCKLRSSLLDNWISSKTQVVVATVAFGMGIDRKDVRVVCHYNIPKSMEAFYQESGRAGRDQLPSQSLVYYGLEDRRKMEFILRKSASKRSQSNSDDSSSEKSLPDFYQITDYCKKTDCRRKKILGCFGEEVDASLCNKSCDACQHPDRVLRNLEELTSTITLRQRNGSSQIFMSSYSDLNGEEQFSEFWNRDDEASEHEDDISDSDDPVEILAHTSKSPRRWKIVDRIESLQRAEENYYGKVEKVVNKAEKNIISETLRGSGKQRLLNAMKLNQQQLLNDTTIDMCACCEILEKECYEKYKKSGKSLYISQIASTSRWLSTAKPDELKSRLGGLNPTVDLSEEAGPEPESSSSITLSAPCGPEVAPWNDEKEKATSDISFKSNPQASPDITPPPPVLSFSEFINSRRKAADGQHLACKRPLDDCIGGNLEKKGKN